MRPPDWAIRTRADERALALGYYWDEEKATRPIQFAEKFFQGKYVGRLELFEWQERLIRCLFGWRRPDGSRRFRKAHIHVAKKNGKSLLTAILSLYELYCSDERNPLVGTFSTTEDNAKQIYDHLAESIRARKRLAKRATLTASDQKIQTSHNGGEFVSYSSDARNAEGRNFSLVVCDEMHAWEGPALWRAIEYATIARAEGTIVTISTAGQDKTHFYYDIFERAKKIARGDHEALDTLAEVHECAEGKEEDPEEWKRANPSLDCYGAFTSERFREQLEEAKQSLADWCSFRRYRLNQWIGAEGEQWLDLRKWDANLLAEIDLKGKPCYVGVDLSQRVDPSSVALCWYLGDRRYFIRSWAWVCEAGAREREKSNLPRYEIFRQAGVLQFCPGDYVSETTIEEFLRGIVAGWKPKGHIFDQYNFRTLAEKLEKLGQKVHYLPQSFNGWNDHARAWEKAVNEGRVFHDGNPLLRYAVGNVRIEQNSESKIRPARKKSLDKIDPVIAAMMAFAGCRGEEVKEAQGNSPKVRYV